MPIEINPWEDTLFNKSTFTLGVILSTGLAVAASAETVIKVGHGAAESFHMHRAILHFEKLVEAGSGGEIDVQIFPSSQMGPDREMIEGVQIEFDENFFILDKGREKEERSVVLVEDGMYRGFGYVSLEEVEGGVDVLRDAIKYYRHYPESVGIIRQFLYKGNGIQLIKF